MMGGQFMGAGHADELRNFARCWDHGSAIQRDAANNLPAVQPHPQKQKGSLPVGDVQSRWDSVVLLALRIYGREILR